MLAKYPKKFILIMLYTNLLLHSSLQKFLTRLGHIHELFDVGSNVQAVSFVAVKLYVNIFM